jgi:serine/threonine protein phosphatase PrpC
MNCEHYLVSNTNIEAYGLTITGQVRQANEDSCGFATVPNGELFVVCDGMGGHVGGATASRIAVEQIIQYFKAQRYPNIYQALHDALCRANIQIIGAANAEPSLKGMGTTACIVLFDGNDAYIAHVGDSRIYLYEGQKNRLFRITKDHSFVQSLVDMGQLDDREAEHHPRKNVIMKALGTKEELKPEVYMSPVQPAKGDMFLICSDGLSGMVDDDGIEAILSTDQSIEQKVLDLVTNANVPGKGLDNITAQVIKVVESPYPFSNHPDHNPNWRKEAYSTPNLNVANNPAPQQVAPPKKKKTKLLLAILIPAVVLMLLIGGGVAAYFIWWHGKEKIEEPIQTKQEAEEGVNLQDAKNEMDENTDQEVKAETESESKAKDADGKNENKTINVELI